jgi:aryl-alcohol dehydrogenase-like predicted oxidoreductase
LSGGNGCATPEGTISYAVRSGCPPEHFRVAQGLTISSIGLGTYLGDADDASDRAYIEAISVALKSGVNVLDSAINYRFQRSERCIGAALKGANRQEVFISTKAGFLTPDGDMPADPRAYFEAEYFSRGIMSRDEVAGGMHCMSPRFLEDQLNRSRRNLGIDTIDLFYLHNPETQPPLVGAAEFARRLLDAFEFLEAKVADGAIRWYGAATWNGFRVPSTAQDHLPLEMLYSMALEAGGEDHHFRFVQLPLNLAMPEALTAPTQTFQDKEVSLLGVASALGITVMSSGSLRQAGLVSGLPPKIGEAFPGLSSDAQRAIQFTRSTPGVTTALVGMGHAEHVRENLELAKTPPATREEFMRLFR